MKLDEKTQKQERYTISKLGNLEELDRFASDTAAWITLYYKEQIESIDTSQKIKGSSIFSEMIKSMKDIAIKVRPERNEEIPVIIVAEYIVAWIIDALKSGKINPSESLHEELWFCVAKKNCIDVRKKDTLTDSIGSSVGRVKIALKRLNDNGKQIEVQLRHFIGCVSLVGNDGTIYQYKVEKKDESFYYMKDLDIFGYAYTEPFSKDSSTLQSIVESRQLIPAFRSIDGEILTRFDDIIQMLHYYQNSNAVGQSSATSETAFQVAKVLHEQKLFIDPTTLKNELEKSRHDIEYSINILVEDFEQKSKYYKTSIDTLYEEYATEAEKSRETMKIHAEILYKQYSEKLNQQLQDRQAHFDIYISQCMKQLTQEIQDTFSQMMQIVQAAKSESSQALKSSERSEKQTAKAIETATKLIEVTEKQRQKLHETTEKCQSDVEQAILEQKQVYEKDMAEVHVIFNNNVEYAKQAIE